MTTTLELVETVRDALDVGAEVAARHSATSFEYDVAEGREALTALAARVEALEAVAESVRRWRRCDEHPGECACGGLDAIADAIDDLDDRGDV